MLDKIFGWSKKKEGETTMVTPQNPIIPFGRYSDINKPVDKVDKWNEADSLFKEKKIPQSIATFFEYLCDDAVKNVEHQQNGTEGTFMIYQGSKIVRGFYNGEMLEAEVSLAGMPQPSVPVMRRLLEMNFSLYYTRYACNGDKLTMMFDTDIATANPSKLYYGLKELATKADKQDDLLVQDFTSLLPVDNEHVQEVPQAEKEIKYKWMQTWIQETFDIINAVDHDKYSGGIAYLLLALAYRIDFMLVPEGKLLLELEKIVEIYFRKDDRPVTEKNQEMIDEFHKLQARTKEEVFPFLFRSRYTFSIVTPQNHKTIADAIYNANQNINWYKENKHPEIAEKISEYGIAYCQYSYSLPRPLTELFLLFMMVNYQEFFVELGYNINYYKKAANEFNKEGIIQTINEITEAWKAKYPELKFATDKIRFENLMTFNQSFTSEIEFLNLETK